MSPERNAIIKAASIEIDDHGFLSAWLHLDYGGSSQGFGGYSLFSPNHSKDIAGQFVWRCLEIGGVRSWDKLPGKTIRVRLYDGLVRSIGHIVNDDWFTPSVEFTAQE